MTTWIERVETELEELEAKITGLSKFLNNDEALEGVSNTQKLLLSSQYVAMNTYAGILGCRLMEADREQMSD